MSTDHTEEQGLVDVSGLPLSEVLREDEQLAASVQRLVEGLHDPDGVISGFSNAITGEDR